MAESIAINRHDDFDRKVDSCMNELEYELDTMERVGWIVNAVAGPHNDRYVTKDRSKVIEFLFW